VQVLLVGKDTSIGLALTALLLSRGHKVRGLRQDDCVWKNIPEAEAALRPGGDLVVNVIIQNTFDSRVRITAEHLSSVLRLAKACEKKRIPIVHLSSAFVFSGMHKNPYREGDERSNKHPLAEIIKSAENAITGSAERYVMLRFGPIFGSVGVNIITGILDSILDNKRQEFSNNTRGCPVSSVDAARVIAAIIDQISCGAEPWGTYHYCSSDQTSCFEFAEALLATASQFVDYAISPLILQDEKESKRVIRREMNCDKILNTFGIKQQHWRAVLIECVEGICNGKTSMEKSSD
tara:strand:+ start:246 stop:1124 length:879 start_codon:yes stop_codon:yes gene_type:complete